MILNTNNYLQNLNSISNYKHHLNMFAYTQKHIADFVFVAASEAFFLNECIVAVWLTNDGYWTAYSKPVPPDLTIGELSKVVATGNKLNKAEAAVHFTKLNILLYEE